MKIVKRCCIVQLQLHRHPVATPLWPLTPDPQRSLNDTHRKGSTEIARYNAHTHTHQQTHTLWGGGVALHNFSFALEALKSQWTSHFPTHSSAEQRFPQLFRSYTHTHTRTLVWKKRKSQGTVEWSCGWPLFSAASKTATPTLSRSSRCFSRQRETVCKIVRKMA